MAFLPLPVGTLASRRAQVNGVRLHWVEAGEGTPVLLLHGFPELWYAWRFQIPALLAAGYRVIAPDLRGYNASEAPPRISSYRIPALVGDMVALLDHLDAGPTAWIGHDWGGVVAWHATMRHSEAVERLAILNAPHPALFAKALRGSPSQMLRSWYAGLFQLPWLPEAAMAAGGRALLRRMLRGGPAPGDAELTAYLEAFPDRASLTAPVHYYRAALRRPPPRPLRISRPTLVIWGDRDRYLLPDLTEGLGEWVEDLRIRHLPEAGHWLHQRSAEEVNGLLIDFLAGALHAGQADGAAPRDTLS
jgi:epoxide hydrolase 4